jgi:GxxExxY protein
MLTRKHVNDLAYGIVGCAIEVHKEIGPGLLESIYRDCLIEELRLKNFSIATEVPIPVTYKGKKLEHGLRLDIVVNNLVIVEIKSVEHMIPLYQAQLLSYLNLTHMPKGILINFNCDNIVKNIVPLVTLEFSKLPIE